jgi:hypothetical protein
VRKDPHCKAFPSIAGGSVDCDVDFWRRAGKTEREPGVPARVNGVSSFYSPSLFRGVPGYSSELDTDDAEIIDDNEGRTDDSFGSSDSISADEDYDLAIQAIGSLTEAGTDSAASYSDGLEYSGSGGSDWQYDDFDDGDNNSGSGGGSYESDVDLFGTDSSDGDSGPDTSVTFSSERDKGGHSALFRGNEGRYNTLFTR